MKKFNSIVLVLLVLVASSIRFANAMSDSDCISELKKQLTNLPSQLGSCYFSTTVEDGFDPSVSIWDKDHRNELAILSYDIAPEGLKQDIKECYIKDSKFYIYIKSSHGFDPVPGKFKEKLTIITDKDTNQVTYVHLFTSTNYMFTPESTRSVECSNQ